MLANKLRNGSNVAIIGGGPAGSFFALYLFHYSQKLGLDLQADIYEPRPFGTPGPRGCNHCAGILSASLLRNLNELSIKLPDTVIQSVITGYSLHSPYGVMQVQNPEPQFPIYSVYRAGGPLSFPLGAEASLDYFLLEQARSKGAGLIRVKVAEVHVSPRPAIVCEGEERRYDLIALACGVNTLNVEIKGLNYVSPRTRRMAQEELHASREDIAAAFGNSVRVYLFPKSDLVFGSLIPKGDFINVSLLSQGPAPFSIEYFLNNDLVKRALPFHYVSACGCKPLIAVGPALNPMGDGFVAIGDACVTHLYKDGIGSALLTARAAARTAVMHGIGYDDFRANYLPVCWAMERDNAWGKVLFRFHVRTKDSRRFFLAEARLVSHETSPLPQRRPVSQIAWGLFTGSYSYGRLMKLSLSPGVLLKLASALAADLLGKHPSERGARLDKDINIVILGGGFGGMYTALNLRKSIGKKGNAKVTLVSRENFFLFTPFLHEVATGGIETRHIAYPIRNVKGWGNFRFIHGEADSVDLSQKKVFLEQLVLDYDYLVLALGSVTDTRGLGWSDDNVFTLKTLRDGMLLRNHLIRMFEAADAEPDAERQSTLLTFMVVGGGSTGVQLVTEMRDFIHRFLVKDYPRLAPSRIRVVLVQDKGYILDGMDAKLGAYALNTLRHKGIDVRLGTQVTSIGPESVRLAGEEEVPTKTVVWVAGIRANPLVAAMPLARDQIDRVIVNEYLEVPAFPSVYALGDIAHFSDERWPEGLPPRAHIAVRQAPIVARNIAAGLQGCPRARYRYSHMGEMVSLGSHTAAIAVYGLRLYGIIARVIWLNTYLSLLMGTYNRVRVLTDWLLGPVFGRDTTLLDIK